jgi:hypothetical protein
VVVVGAAWFRVRKVVKAGGRQAETEFIFCSCFAFQVGWLAAVAVYPLRTAGRASSGTLYPEGKFVGLLCTRFGTAGLASSGTGQGRRVPSSHCWASQQWHPVPGSGARGTVVRGKKFPRKKAARSCTLSIMTQFGLNFAHGAGQKDFIS